MQHKVGDIIEYEDVATGEVTRLRVVEAIKTGEETQRLVVEVEGEANESNRN